MKARINSRDPIAEALELSYNRLKGAVKSDDSSQAIRVDIFIALSGNLCSKVMLYSFLTYLIISNCWLEPFFRCHHAFLITILGIIVVTTVQFDDGFC
jgi:hypothetical protein